VFNSIVYYGEGLIDCGFVAKFSHSLSDRRWFDNCNKEGNKEELHKLARQIIFKNMGFKFSLQNFVGNF
jgi:hypothetical protein